MALFPRLVHRATLEGIFVETLSATTCIKRVLGTSHASWTELDYTPTVYILPTFRSAYISGNGSTC